MLLVRILNIPNYRISFLGNYPFLIVAIVVVEMFISYNYFSEEKIIDLNAYFEEMGLIKRRLWVCIFIISLIVPILIGAILLNH
jgi:hypothetical protein